MSARYCAGQARFNSPLVIQFSAVANDMSEIFQLELPAGATLEGLAGTAREQPEFSVKDPLGRHRPNRFLTGGAEQVYFKVKNPFWVRRVHLW